MSTFVINQNNIDTIYHKACKYIAANEYQYERLSWQTKQLEKTIRKYEHYKYFEKFGYRMHKEDKPLCQWKKDALAEYNKIADSFTLAKHIVFMYHASNGADVTVFQELHVNSKDMENILLVHLAYEVCSSVGRNAPRNDEVTEGDARVA